MWNGCHSRKSESTPAAWRRTVARITKTLASTAAAVTLLAAGASSANAQTSYRQGGDPDYHVVENGDTLWDLSGRYYGDTYQWPRMWSYNAHITNPHWIYPGDIVYLRDSEQGAQPQPDGGQQQSQKKIVTSDSLPSGMYLPLGGYITDDEVEYVGRIIASRKEANMLGEHDTAWVGFGDAAYDEKEEDVVPEDERHKVRSPKDVHKGDKFAVVREVGTLTDDDDNVIAHKYVVLGAVEVTKTSDEYYDEVKFTQSWQEIYRGDMLIPYERQLKVVQQSKASTDGVAKIIDTLNPGSIFAEQQYVFINKGAEDGVRMGNRFFVYQRYEGLHKGLSDAPLSDKVPWSRVGQVIVLDVRKHYSTALVIDSKRELVIGNRLEMYSGH